MRASACVLVFFLLGSVTQARGLLVFAASSTTEAMRDVGTAFQAKTGVKVDFSFAASSTLATQIRAGAPADLFLSAGEPPVNRLQAKHPLAERRDLLANQLVVVVRKNATHVPSQAKDLLAYRRIALADPTSVPAGVYARTWLERLGLWTQIAPKVIPALNVRAALALVESGAAKVAVVYATDVPIAPKTRIAFRVTGPKAPSIRYPLARLSTSKAARAFFDFLFSKTARAIFARRGFSRLPVTQQARVEPAAAHGTPHGAAR